MLVIGMQRFSNPSGSYSANLSILARGQAGTKSRSLLFIPSAVPTGLSRPPTPQDLSALLCSAQQLRKDPRNASSYAQGLRHDRTPEGLRDDCGGDRRPRLSVSFGLGLKPGSHGQGKELCPSSVVPMVSGDRLPGVTFQLCYLPAR